MRKGGIAGKEHDYYSQSGYKKLFTTSNSLYCFNKGLFQEKKKKPTTTKKYIN